jgi:hypothetical protein
MKQRLENSDPFWFDQPSILWQRDRLSEYFPAPNMSWAETLNSLVRASAYIALILCFWFSSDKPAYILLFALLLTFIIAKYPGVVSSQLTMATSWLDGLRTKKENEELKVKEKTKQIQVDQFVGSKEQENTWKEGTIQPTTDNPFMNLNLITDPYNRAPAPLSYNSPSLQEKIEEDYSHNLYRDVGDVWNNSHGQLNFNTMPATTMPNDQTAFARWCYATPPTCKEEGIRCIAYDINPQNPIGTSAQALFYPSPAVPSYRILPSS